MTEKNLCVESLRHAEYYGMQETFNELYSQSKDGKIFTDLMSKIISRENILLAYRNIKTNAGSKTAGTDKLEKYCALLELNSKQLAKVNLLRKSAGLLPIKSS